jgi:hypothetical protein
MLIGKKSNLEAGYVFAPYIMMATSTDVLGVTGHVGNPGLPGLYYKQWIRKTKIENIFNKKSS